jgi:hypothetical protein
MQCDSVCACACFWLGFFLVFFFIRNLPRVEDQLWNLIVLAPTSPRDYFSV